MLSLVVNEEYIQELSDVGEIFGLTVSIGTELDTDNEE